MKKIKEFTKKNIKLIIGLLIGTFVSGIGVYASTILYTGNEISFDNSKANLTLNNQSVTNMQEAMDALYEKTSNAGGATCKNSPFKLGDYVDMTPTSSSFTPDRTLTGLVGIDTFRGSADGTTTVAGTLDPSELSVWRVIRINSDCTVEMVSEFVSSQNVKFAYKDGYMNYVYYLNEIAKQYANTTYTLDPSDANTPDGAFRNLGYDGQTPILTDSESGGLSDTSLGTETGAGYQTKLPNESLGGGDTGFGTDMKLLEEARVNLIAYKYGTTTFTAYWLASRLYYWYSTSAWNFYTNCVGSSGAISATILYSRGNSRWYAYSTSYAVRPVVTLDSRVKTNTGDGTSGSHYTLKAKTA